jgi:hypothetical protein
MPSRLKRRGIDYIKTFFKVTTSLECIVQYHGKVYWRNFF